METRSNYLHCSGRKASKRKRFEEEGVYDRIILKYILRFSSQQYTAGLSNIWEIPFVAAEVGLSATWDISLLHGIKRNLLNFFFNYLVGQFLCAFINLCLCYLVTATFNIYYSLRTTEYRVKVGWNV